MFDIVNADQDRQDRRDPAEVIPWTRRALMIRVRRHLLRLGCSHMRNTAISARKRLPLAVPPLPETSTQSLVTW